MKLNYKIIYTFIGMCIIDSLSKSPSNLIIILEHESEPNQRALQTLHRVENDKIWHKFHFVFGGTGVMSGFP